MKKLIIPTLAFICLLYFGDRIIAGMVQCDSAMTCPYSTPLEGER